MIKRFDDRLNESYKCLTQLKQESKDIKIIFALQDEYPLLNKNQVARLKKIDLIFVVKFCKEYSFDYKKTLENIERMR